MKIPGGINEGMRIRSAGNGEPGTNSGPAGDLYIEIRVKPHEIFERDGDDLHCTVPVGLEAAALGGAIEVPTLGQQARYRAAEGTPHGNPSVCAARASRGAFELSGRPFTATFCSRNPGALTEHQRKFV